MAVFDVFCVSFELSLILTQNIDFEKIIINNDFGKDVACNYHSCHSIL